MRTRALLPETDLLRIRADINLDPKRRSALGQFFTPAPICEYMASLFTKIEGEIHLLDPGAGVGSLSSAFVDEALRRGAIQSLKLTAYDVESSVYPYLEHMFQACLRNAYAHGVEFDSALVPKDFILDIADVFAHSLFFEQKEHYSHVIVNPPYKKISNKSLHRQALRQANIETVNLYTGFLALAIKSLKPGGEIVAIVPRSFCNGLYYQPFREFLLSEVALHHIHIFGNRNYAFSDNDVLQENIIFAAVKHAKQRSVTISSSPTADFQRDSQGQLFATDLTVRTVELEQIVKTGDRQKFIHITPDQQDQSIVNNLACFHSTLEELGLEVSTGPVVDFRLKGDLRTYYEKGSVPLLYATHLKATHLGGGIDWPKSSKKPNAIYVSKKSRPWLWENQGSFVLTRRFSSKEEKRRIVATHYDSSLPGALIGFDNKLNVFHGNKTGLDPVVAKGLWVYLNSTLLDLYYRQFGGHTQVNATDLRTIRYPNLESLQHLGKKVEAAETLSQIEIDQLLKEEIDEMTGTSESDPLQVQMKIDQAIEVLVSLGMPKAQQNQRSALTLLALLNLKPEGHWQSLERPLMGVTPIMDWCRDSYGKSYAPNTRETFRRQTLHQFRDAGLVLYNPDQPNRAVNSPKACYQITSECVELFVTYGTAEWSEQLSDFLRDRPTLTEIYAKARKMAFVPLKVSEEQEITLTPGPHSELIRDIVEEFGPRFAPGAELIYVGDTGKKAGYFQEQRLEELGVTLDRHGKLPDVILFDSSQNWLLLIESVTSHGPVDAKRHRELSTLFSQANPDLVFVTAFPDRKTMAEYLATISWETEVWIANSPTHMIHFNGDKFFGPHA